MKKMLIGIGMLSILSISAMATNVTNYKKTQKEVMNVYSYLEFLDKEKYEDLMSKGFSFDVTGI